MARPFPRVLWYFTIWFMKMQQLFEKKFVKKAEIFPTCFVEKFRHKMLCFFVKNRLVLRGFRFAFCRYCGHEQPAARAVPTGCAQSTGCFFVGTAFHRPPASKILFKPMSGGQGCFHSEVKAAICGAPARTGLLRLPSCAFARKGISPCAQGDQRRCLWNLPPLKRRAKLYKLNIVSIKV